jgi:hypothetical protein
MSYGLRVVGLREYRRDLKRADAAIGPAIREANRRVAEVVAARARQNAATQPRIHARRPRAVTSQRQHWGDYVQSIKALASQTRAQVSLGSARVPWALGQNFGAVTKTQFPPSLGHHGGDYALYKSIEETTLDQIRVFRQETDTVWRIAHPEAA